jgi:CubicO group peptidase (beta-lactamase class C family)
MISQVALQQRISALVESAPMPAVAVAVVTATGKIAQVVRGTADLTTSAPVTPEHWWDLASVTKVLITLPEVLALAGTVAGLDVTLGDMWPRAHRTPIGQASLADLLSHRSGLPAQLPFYASAADRDEVVAAALEAPLCEAEPVYSDLGFLLLGEAVAAATGRSLGDLAGARSGLRFGPFDSPAVATEHCPWRERLIVGEVHDENSSAMGGVAGHAGGFGRISDVAEAARRWLTHTAVAGELHQAALRAWASNGAGEVFGLGWWLNPTRHIGGPHAGPDSYGASGFVGNRMWFEPSRGYAVVVLSNRVHPLRGPREIFNAWCEQLLSMVTLAHTDSLNSQSAW